MKILILVIIILFLFFKKISSFSSVSNKKIAVITAVYGGYEKLKDHSNVKNSELFDWYCFTEDISLKSPLWKIINTPYHLINNPENSFKNNYTNIRDTSTKNMMYAKYYKTQMHNIYILKKYDYYIWIDGSLHLRDNFVKNVIQLFNQDADLINFKHSVRNNVKDELMLCKNWAKYKNQDLQKQYNNYIKNGFTDDVNLFELTSFFRKNNKIVNDLFNLWWEHNEEHSYQDQISFPYVIWKFKNKFVHYILEQNVMDNQDFCYNGQHLINPF